MEDIVNTRVLRILSSEVDNIQVQMGQVLVCIDDEDTFVDIDDRTRILTEKNIIVDELPTTGDISESKLYTIKTDDGSGSPRIYLYLSGTGFLEATDFNMVLEIVGPQLILTPALFSRHDIPYAPKTLASVTYLSNGENVEDRLKNMVQLGVSVIELEVTEDGQSEFILPSEPDENGIDPYAFLSDAGTYVDLRIGSTFISKRRYTLVDRVLTILHPTEYSLKAGRCLTLVCWFNSKIPSREYISQTMSGAYIAPGTIDTSRLTRVSSMVNLPDPTTLATSKAVSDMYDIINQKLSDHHIFRCTPTDLSTSSNVIITIEDYTLQHGDTFYITLNKDLGADAILDINGSAYPIYERGSELSAIKSGVYNSGEVLKVYYDSILRKYITLYPSDIDYRIISITDIHTVEHDGESEFTINIDGFSSSKDSVKVYHNNLILFEGINYGIVGNKLTLTDYSATKDDSIVIVVDRIVRV